MQSEHLCPHCRSPVAAEDVNVAADLVLCRVCGKTSSFSLIVSAAEISPDCLAHPPKWVRTQRNSRGDRRVVFRRPSPLLLFLVPFTALWSGLSMAGIYGSQFAKGQFDLGASLFGLPFLFGTIVLVGAIAFLAFGRWEVTMGRGQGTVFAGVGRLGWTRRFAYDRHTLVFLRRTSVEVNDVPQRGICVRNGDRSFVFGTLIQEDAKHYIAAWITQGAADPAAAADRL